MTAPRAGSNSGRDQERASALDEDRQAAELDLALVVDAERKRLLCSVLLLCPPSHPTSHAGRRQRSTSRVPSHGWQSTAGALVVAVDGSNGIAVRTSF